MPIASYAGRDRQIKRLMILLESERASNSSTDIMKEYTAILDKLLERKKFDTFTYKLFLKNMLAYLKEMQTQQRCKHYGQRFAEDKRGELGEGKGPLPLPSTRSLVLAERLLPSFALQSSNLREDYFLFDEIKGGVSSYLQQLVNILSSKKIYSIIVIGTPDKNRRIFQNFDPPLEFDSEITYTCSLLTLNASSLFPNIVEGKNDTLYYSVAEGSALRYSPDSAEVKSIKFDTGCYNVEDLDKHIQDVLAAEDGTPRIKLKLNQGSGKSMFKLKPGYKVYFKDKANTFADLLGFCNVDLQNLEYTEQTLTSTRIVNLVKDLLIFVSVDCVEVSLHNGKQTLILFSFLNNIKWGYPINLIAKYFEEDILKKQTRSAE